MLKKSDNNAVRCGFAAILTLGGFASTATLSATQCGPQVPCAVVRPGTVVFLGQFLDPGVEPTLGRTERPAVLSVVEAFAGLDGSTKTVQIVGVKFWENPQGLWLITAKKAQDGSALFLDFCGNTGPVAEMQEELNYLRRRSRGETVARIYGHARVFFDDLAGTEVIARSAEAEYRTRTGEDGTFMISPVLPGRYQVHLDLPASDRSLYLPAPPDPSVESALPGDRDEVDVLAGTCQQSYLALNYNGVISGVVVHRDSSRAGGIALQLDPVDDDKFSRRQRTIRSGPEGSFVFEGVNPGRYRLGVNILGYERTEPYPATYFSPGREGHEPYVISLGKSESLDGLRFEIPNPTGLRTFNVLVTDRDGEPVEGANVADAPSTSKHFYHLPSIGKTDREGRISFEGVAGVRYALLALVRDRERDRVLTSEAKVTPKGAGVVSIRLIVEDREDSGYAKCEWDASQEKLISEKSRLCAMASSDLQ